MKHLTVKFNSFSKEPAELINSELKAVEKVIRSGWWILGSNVEEFENLWMKQCENSKTVGVANGLDAIEIGLRS